MQAHAVPLPLDFDPESLFADADERGALGFEAWLADVLDQPAGAENTQQQQQQQQEQPQQPPQQQPPLVMPGKQPQQAQPQQAAMQPVPAWPQAVLWPAQPQQMQPTQPQPQPQQPLFVLTAPPGFMPVPGPVPGSLTLLPSTAALQWPPALAPGGPVAAGLPGDWLYAAAGLSPFGQAPAPSAGVASPSGGALTSPGSGAWSGGSGAGTTAKPALRAASGVAKRSGRKPAQPADPNAPKPKGPSTRFRERQKELIRTLEAEVAAKLSQLGALSAENEDLKLRAAVLDATIKGREYNIKVIKEHGPPVECPELTARRAAEAAAAREAAGLAAESCSGSGSDADGDSDAASSEGGSSAGGGAGSSGDSSSDDELPASAAGAVSGVPSSSPALTSSSGSRRSHSLSQPGRPRCAGKLPANPAGCTPAQHKRTVHCIKQMSSDDIVKHWRQFLDEVAEQLLLVENEEGSGATTGGEAASDEPADTAEHGVCRGCGGLPAPALPTPASAADTMAQIAQPCRWCSCGEREGLAHVRVEDAAAAAGLAPPGAAGLAATPSAAGSAPVAGGAAGAAPSVVGDLAGGGAWGPGLDLSSAPVQRIVGLVNKYSYMTKYVAMLNPAMLYRLFGRNLDSGQPAPYSDAHWARVVARLKLTPQQVTAVLACAELYFRQLHKVLVERAALQAKLTAAQADAAAFALPGAASVPDQIEVLDALYRNLRRENSVRNMLSCFMWGRVLNSVQFARAAVQSHPFFIDSHAIVTVLVMQYKPELLHAISAASAAEAAGSGAQVGLGLAAAQPTPMVEA